MCFTGNKESESHSSKERMIHGWLVTGLNKKKVRRYWTNRDFVLVLNKEARGSSFRSFARRVSNLNKKPFDYRTCESEPKSSVGEKWAE